MLNPPESSSALLQTEVMAVLSSSGFVDSSQGCEGPLGLVLQSTNFYAEQGGQVAETGRITSSSGHTFDVQDTQVGRQPCVVSSVWCPCAVGSFLSGMLPLHFSFLVY